MLSNSAVRYRSIRSSLPARWAIESALAIPSLYAAVPIPGVFWNAPTQSGFSQSSPCCSSSAQSAIS